MSEYIFERLRDEHLPKLVPLFKDAFGKDITVDRIKNKFDTLKYALKKHIAFVALNTVNEEIIALYILFPSLIYYKGEYYLSAQVGDLMTHSEHRRKGLFVKLAELTHDLAKSEGVKFIYTFPFGNNLSYKGFVNRLGFTHNESFNSYVIKVKTIPLCKLVHRFSFLKPLHKAYLNFIMYLFFKKSETFDDNIKYKEGHVVKNNDFFEYKFSYSPGYIIDLKGTKAWFKLTRFGSISLGDLNNYNNISQSLSLLKRFCFLCGVRAIQIETSPGTGLDLTRIGYKNDKHNYNICYLKLDDNVPADKFKFVFGDLDNF